MSCISVLPIYVARCPQGVAMMSDGSCPFGNLIEEDPTLFVTEDGHGDPRISDYSYE